MIDTILFDLDGTLLPMDYDIFTKGYFKGLVAKLATYKNTTFADLYAAIRSCL